LSTGKVKVEVFIPSGNCACSFALFLDKVWQVVMRYQSVVNCEIKDTASPEAKKYGITWAAVVVNEAEKLPPGFEGRDLEAAIRNSLPKNKLVQKI